ncbi:MAG TPA: phosphoribosyltransferase family protein [Rhodocyclaceae bacterium]|nr:phosphoribosyltransferase family protein [Rhodocyclaceae bacterium]
MGERFTLYDRAGVEALLDDMARQVAAFDATPLVIVGVLRRGAPLAEALESRLRGLRPAWSIERIDLKVQRYGDDLRLLHPETRLEADVTQRKLEFAGRRVLIVDDVLYHGHSLLRVLEFLRTHGADSVHAAVLVDRCIARLPVVADIVGARLQISHPDVIECNVPPYEQDLRIDVCRL